MKRQEQEVKNLSSKELLERKKEYLQLTKEVELDISKKYNVRLRRKFKKIRALKQERHVLKNQDYHLVVETKQKETANSIKNKIRLLDSKIDTKFNDIKRIKRNIAKLSKQAKLEEVATKKLKSRYERTINNNSKEVVWRINTGQYFHVPTDNMVKKSKTIDNIDHKLAISKIEKHISSKKMDNFHKKMEKIRKNEKISN